MKNSFLSVGVAIVLLLSLPLPTLADTKVDIEGQLRSRTEVDRKEFSPDYTTRTFSDFRTRLGLRLTVADNALAFVQFQDSRRLGGTTPTGDQSGTLVNTANIDVHQVFVRIKNLWQNGPGLQAGRFEVNLGNQRVFGAVGWHNVGRSWEGFRADWHFAATSVEIFWLKRLELNHPIRNEDFDIIGGQLALIDWGAECFLVYEKDADIPVGRNHNALDRLSTGLFYQRQAAQFDVIGNFVYQFGDQLAPAGTIAEQDISALLVTLETGYSFKNGRAAIGIDYASGDDDPADGSFSAYNNLYYTGHKFRGYLDYFLTSQPQGLLDLVARLNLKPASGWKLGADLHYFRTAADYLTAENELAAEVGVELDVYVSTSRIRGVDWSTGASLFLPSEAYAGPEADPGYWLYTMFSLGFAETILE